MTNSSIETFKKGKDDLIEDLINPMIKISIKDYPFTIHTEKYKPFIDQCPDAKFIYKDIKNFKEYYYNITLKNEKTIRIDTQEFVKNIALKILLRVKHFKSDSKTMALKKEFEDVFRNIVDLIRKDLKRSYKAQLLNSY